MTGKGHVGVRVPIKATIVLPAQRKQLFLAWTVSQTETNRKEKKEKELKSEFSLLAQETETALRSAKAGSSFEMYVRLALFVHLERLGSCILAVRGTTILGVIVCETAAGPGQIGETVPVIFQ